MFFVSIVLSLALLFLMVVPYRGKQPGIANVLIGAISLVIGWPCLHFPSLSLQYLLLAALFGAKCYWKFSQRAYTVAACVISVVVYCVVSWGMWTDITKLRAKFPYESMETRLVSPRKDATPRRPLVSEVALDALEQRVDSDGGFYRDYRQRTREFRDGHFQELHERAVLAFINSPGFGIGRFPTLERFLERLPSEETILAQPTATPPRDNSYQSDNVVTPEPEWPFQEFHNASVADFVYLEGFGYFKDRRHVAGFRPHQFRSVPNPQAQWRLASLHLIGLVLHHPPAVYVSDSLPRMDLLQKAKLRPLDAFESAGLAELKAGKHVYIREEVDRLRMLGAVRATKQCLDCHGCERGDLLGAFSYVIRR
jgi:hypothetical protein